MKRISSVIVALIFITAFSLSACTGGGSANAIPFSETVTGDGIRIWYECQNKIEETEDETDAFDDLFGTEEEVSTEPVEFGRETRVVWIRVYNNGKLTTYSTLKNVYLGYFAKMTDEEIIKALESDEDTFLCSQKDQAFEIYLYSDASGHEIMYEGVPTIIQIGKEKSPMYFMTLINKDSIKTFPVYESYYGGYNLLNYDETPFGQACLVTRCEKGDVFGLDSLELEGAIVDYATPEDMLREKNKELEKANPKGKKGKTEEVKEGDADAEGESDTASENVEGEDTEG